MLALHDPLKYEPIANGVQEQAGERKQRPFALFRVLLSYPTPTLQPRKTNKAAGGDMPGGRDTAGGGVFSPSVLQQLDKENVITPNISSRTPGTGRRPAKGFRVYQDEGREASCPSTSKSEKPSQTSADLAYFESEVARLKSSLIKRNERVLELKASAASANARSTALMKSHEEANKELGLLRAQVATGGGGGGGAGNVERLKAAAESLETNNELLREERDSLDARLAKRETALAGFKGDVAAAANRERGLKEELDAVREELAMAERDFSDRDAKAQGQADTGNRNEGEWTLQKAALDAQVIELETQLNAAGRRCAAVAAEKAVLAEESTRREREHESTVAALQEELQSLHRRTSADLGDWQRRHREAIGAKKAVEGQLDRLVGVSKSIARVAEHQAILEASFQEACELLSTTVVAETTHRGDLPVRSESPERVVEGVLENVLGRVFEATMVSEDAGVTGTDENGGREREAKQILLQEEVVLLGETLEKLTAEMETLRTYGVAQSEVFLEQTQTELASVRERYEVAVSDVQAVRAQSAQEVEQLTQRLSDEDNKRKQLELKLDSTAHELATTVQLSELALAAKSAAGEEERQEEETRRATEEAQRAEELEAHNVARREELETERRAYADTIYSLEGEHRVLQEKLEESASMESKLQHTEARLCAVVAENEELARKVENVTIEAGRPSPRSVAREADIEVLEEEVATLRSNVAIERERVQTVKKNDVILRKYLVHYQKRNEQKMKDMQNRIARANSRGSEEA